jgi:molybdopterin-guanine dinucleotide biosynthesis protein MobB
MEKIVVAGRNKGVGKTAVSSFIIRNLKYSVGAIKSSIHENIYNNIATDDPYIINAKGTDTSIFAESGAEKVIFLQSDEGHLKETLSTALDMLLDKDYLVIEGNRVLDYLNPALIIYVDRKGIEAKESAARSETRADIIIDGDRFFSALNNKGEIPFKINIDHISCYKSHLLAKAMGIKIPRIGRIIREQQVKITKCQLGLFR